jgi:outer membrane receptor protein involved in Fe transport
MISRRILVLAACLILACNLSAFAQGNSGLKGKVVDKDGQPLPTARISLKNESLGIDQQTVADATGEFRIAPLPPGKGYVLSASFTGMSTIKMDVELSAGKIFQTLLTLRPDTEMQEKVKVTARGDVVNTESTTSSTTFNSEFIDALPILGRNYQDVLTLAPGVSDVDGDGNPTIHGSRDTDVVTLVDGVSTNDPLTGKRGQEINIDSIDEVEVVTAGASAEYGRAQGGFVTIVTKSGGNEFEGRFSFYWRSNIFDGDGAGIDDPTLHGGLGELGLRDLKFNDFDPSIRLSGPIKKDKAWYFFAPEYIQIQDPVNASTQAFVRTFTEKKVHGKVTWEISTNQKVAFETIWDPQEYDNLGVDSFTALESGYTDKLGGLNLILKETAVFNPNVYLESTVQHFTSKPSATPTLYADTNGNGVLFEDRNHNGFWDAQEGDPGEDFDRDGVFDIFEDRNHNRILDTGEDKDLDGRLTRTGAGCEGVNREDIDCDGNADVFWEDVNHNHQLDPGEAKDNDGKLDYIDEDLNHNGILQDWEDKNGNGVLDTFSDDPKEKDIQPLIHIEDRNNNQILDDRVLVLPSDLMTEVPIGPDGKPLSPISLGATYPYYEFRPLSRDRTFEQDQKTLRISGPNAGQVLGVRHISTDFQSTRGRITLKEDLTVFVPDWHGQHDLKFGVGAERESYEQNTNLRPILFPNAQPATANVIQPTIGVQLPAENHVFNEATSTSFGMYAVDTYKPLPNLTLAVGLRFDREATDSFGYTPFDPVAQRALYDRLHALAGGERGKDDKLLGNNDGLQSFGYCADPFFSDRPGTGNACDHPLQTSGNDPVHDSIATMDQDLARLKAIAPSRLTQHHTSTTVTAASLTSLFPEAVRIDPVTGDQIIDREVLRERGAATFQEQEAFRLTNNNFAPRLSISWDPWADSKTKVFANWGRYYDRLFLDVVVPEEGPDTIFRYYLRDADGVTATGTPNNGIGNPIAKAPPSTSQIDRGLQTPYSDEMTIGFERELAPEVSLKLTYINKKYREQLQDRDINHSIRYTSDGTPLDQIGRLLTSGGAGGDSTSSRVQDGRPDLYIHNFFFNGIYHLDNSNSSKYQGIEVQVTKRLSRKWQMNASYSYSRSLGFADSFYDFVGDDPANRDTVYGYQTDDQRHVVKFNASSYLPKDWQIAGTASWSSGLPYSVVTGFLALDNFDYPALRFLYGYTPDRPDPATGQRNFIPFRRNDQRNDAILEINLHADKAFVLGKMNSKLFLDIENVLNRDNLRIYYYQPSASDRGGALQNIAERDFGRRFQIGFQFEF